MIVERYSLRKTCPYSAFFWSVFSDIWTEYGDLLFDSAVTGKSGSEKTLILVYFRQ